MTSIATQPAAQPDAQPKTEQQFVQYLFFKSDPQWRRLPSDVRERGRREMAAVVADAGEDIVSYAYSTLGLKASAELLLWQKSTGPEPLQDLLCRMLQT